MSLHISNFALQEDSRTKYPDWMCLSKMEKEIGIRNLREAKEAEVYPIENKNDVLIAVVCNTQAQCKQ